MQIEKSKDIGVTVLKVSGEVDLHASPKLRAELQTCVAEKAPVLLVDFTGSSPASRRGINVVMNYTEAYTTYGVKSS